LKEHSEIFSRIVLHTILQKRGLKCEKLQSEHRKYHYTRDLGIR